LTCNHWSYILRQPLLSALAVQVFTAIRMINADLLMLQECDTEASNYSVSTSQRACKKVLKLESLLLEEGYSVTRGSGPCPTMLVSRIPLQLQSTVTLAAAPWKGTVCQCSLGEYELPDQVTCNYRAPLGQPCQWILQSVK